MVYYAIGTTAAWNALTTTEQAKYEDYYLDLVLCAAGIPATATDDITIELISDVTSSTGQASFTINMAGYTMSFYHNSFTYFISNGGNRRIIIDKINSLTLYNMNFTDLKDAAAATIRCFVSLQSGASGGRIFIGKYLHNVTNPFYTGRAMIEIFGCSAMGLNIINTIAAPIVTGSYDNNFFYVIETNVGHSGSTITLNIENCSLFAKNSVTFGTYTIATANNIHSSHNISGSTNSLVGTPTTAQYLDLVDYYPIKDAALKIGGALVVSGHTTDINDDTIISPYYACAYTGPVEWFYAIGTDDAWNSLLPAEQANYKDHFTNLSGFKDALEPVLPDDRTAEFISNVTLRNNTTFTQDGTYGDLKIDTNGFCLTADWDSGLDGTITDKFAGNSFYNIKAKISNQTSSNNPLINVDATIGTAAVRLSQFMGQDSTGCAVSMSGVGSKTLEIYSTLIYGVDKGVYSNLSGANTATLRIEHLTTDVNSYGLHAAGTLPNAHYTNNSYLHGDTSSILGTAPTMTRVTTSDALGSVGYQNVSRADAFYDYLQRIYIAKAVLVDGVGSTIADNTLYLDGETIVSPYVMGAYSDVLNIIKEEPRIDTWDSDKKEYTDIKIASTILDKTTANDFAAPNITILQNKVGSTGEIRWYSGIAPLKVENDTTSADVKVLYDLDQTTGVPLIGNGTLNIDIPQELKDGDYDNVWLLADIIIGSSVANVIIQLDYEPYKYNVNATNDKMTWASGIFEPVGYTNLTSLTDTIFAMLGEEYYYEGISSTETKLFAKDFYYTVPSPTTPFYDIMEQQKLPSDHVEKIKVGQIDGYKITIGQFGGVDLDIRQVGFLVESSVNVLDDEVYTSTHGELVDGKETNNVKTAFEKLATDYTNVTPEKINLTELDRTEWHLGRQITKPKNAMKHIIDLCKSSFVGAFWDRKGVFNAKSWLDDNTIHYAFDATNMTKNTAKIVSETKAYDLYNQFSVKYGYSAGPGEYDKEFFIKNIDKLAFPLISENWYDYVGGLENENYSVAKTLWEKAKSAYNGGAPLKTLEVNNDWFINPENFLETAEEYSGINSPAWKYLENLVEWTTKKKKIVRFRVALEPETLVLKKLDLVTVKHYRLTDNELATGYIVGDKNIPSDVPQKEFTVMLHEKETKIIELEPESLDFTNTILSSDDTQIVKIWNRGNTGMNITSIVVNGDEYEIDGPTPTFVTSGNFQNVSIKYTPVTTNAELGTVTVYNDSNNDEAAVLTMTGSGKVTKRIRIEDNPLEFGNQPSGVPANKNVTVYNEGTEDLTITGYTQTGVFSAQDWTFPTVITADSSSIQPIRCSTPVGVSYGDVVFQSDAQLDNDYTLQCAVNGTSNAVNLDYSITWVYSDGTTATGKTEFLFLGVGGSYLDIDENYLILSNNGSRIINNVQWANIGIGIVPDSWHSTYGIGESQTMSCRRVGGASGIFKVTANADNSPIDIPGQAYYA
jgi:hypothetical protein